MSRNALSFWKEARKQVIGLPDPPPGVSEPAYANFLFFNQCHVGGHVDYPVPPHTDVIQPQGCLKGGAHVTIYWNLLARYCSSCKNTW